MPQRYYSLLKMVRITDNCKHKTTQLVTINARHCSRESVMRSGSVNVRWGFSRWREGPYQRANPERVRTEADRNKESQQDQGQTQMGCGRGFHAGAGTILCWPKCWQVCAPYITGREGTWRVGMLRANLQGW